MKPKSARSSRQSSPAAKKGAIAAPIYPVLLSGGSGTRLWPLSRQSHPKQFLALTGPRTMLQETALRCDDESLQRLIVIGSSEHRFAIAEQSRLNGIVESLTIPNGIDVGRMMQSLYGTSRPAVRASLGLGDDDVLVLSVGTVVERKGQMDLVDAVRKLDETARRKLVLAMVGFNDLDYSARVASELRDLEAGGLRVVSVKESASEDERARVAELYLAADLFVLTSRVESYPRVTLEAMHFGLPIISTPCFGVCEQLVEGMGALFYDFGDTAGLSRLLLMLCEDGDRRRSLGEAAHDRLAQLNSYDGMLDAYESLYARVLARHGRSGRLSA